MTSETDFTIYTVVVVSGGLLQDVVTFADEATAQAYLEGIVVKNEPATVEDTGVALALGGTADVTETRHTYRAANGRTHQAAVTSDLTDYADEGDEVYLEVSPLAPTRPEGSTRLRRVAW